MKEITHDIDNVTTDDLESPKRDIEDYFFNWRPQGPWILFQDDDHPIFEGLGRQAAISILRTLRDNQSLGCHELGFDCLDQPELAHCTLKDCSRFLKDIREHPHLAIDWEDLAPYTLENLPELLLLPDSDPLFEYLGRRTAFSLYRKIWEWIDGGADCISTLTLVELPEYAYIYEDNLVVYNKFLRQLSQRGLIPLRCGHPRDLAEDWVWTLPESADVT